MSKPPFQLLLYDIFYVLILHSSNSTEIVQNRNQFALHAIFFFSMDSGNNGKIHLFSRGRTRKKAAVPSIRQDSSMFLRFYDFNVLNVNDSTLFKDENKIVQEEKKYWGKKRTKINERLFKNVSVFTVY